MKRRKPRVLFLCIGNMCRSPMAEGFARELSRRSIEIWSAGVAPSGRVSEGAVQVMAERGIDISGHLSKGIDRVPLETMDWIVSLGEVSASVVAPPRFAGRLEDWRVRDPVGESLDVYRTVRDDIERLVRELLVVLDAAEEMRE
jgi:arsenate reductase (thioredoxin)